MKYQIKYFVSALLVLALLAGWVIPVYAAGPCTIISISPNFVLSDTATQVVIKGTDFSAGSKVSLEGVGGTSFSAGVNDTLTELTIVVPPNIPANTYNLVVTALDPAASCNLLNGLTVGDPSPLPTSTPAPFSRPQLIVAFSGASGKQITSNTSFKFTVNFNNAGSATAFNTQVVFTSADLFPLDTGGVAVLANVPSGSGVSVDQRFTSQGSLFGKSFVTIDVTLTYYDGIGTAYTDKFTLSVPVKGGTGGGGVAYPTATPTGVNTSQLVITSYASTVDPLQPGEQFQLGITVENMGNTIAKGVTMIIGGGSSGTSGETPQPGGVSGGSGEFTNFAPVGTSNIQSLGDLAAGGALQVKQNLIVNVSTAPGAYPMKITFSYVNKNGEVVNDDLVITLLVYSLPNVDVSFYRPPDPFFAGQPGALPIQVVNLGKRNSVLGSMKIEAIGGTLDPSSTLIGSLDPGGYFTFDSTVFPDAAGPLELTITIDYTDDFNQSRVITKTLELTVEEMMIDPSIDPSLNGGGGGGEVVTDETFFQKVWRFVLGVLGLDSAPPDSGGGITEPLPDQQIVPMPAGGGGKG